MNSSSLTALPAWQALKAHAAALAGQHMRELFAADPDRFARLSFSFGPVRADYSKNRVTLETISLLAELARVRGVEEGRAAMFAGARINTTENRAVLHVALRNREERPMMVDGVDVMPEVRATRARLRTFSDDVRQGRWRGATGKVLRHIVNIGIGGSHLGPMFVADAMKDLQSPEMTVAFVSNPDRAQLDDALAKIDPAETLFIICSKTFTTAETTLNADAARAWLTARLGETAVAKHFAAVSTNVEAAKTFGIHPDAVFPMWDWVGGRYSVWSAIGLSVILVCGYDAFDQLLAGAEAMDRHFETASLEQNLPVILALIGVWYADFFDAPAVAVMPYDYRLKLFPFHLQQLDMESNGKGVTKEGAKVETQTGPIIFGGGGADSQHSFFQLLHQSPRLIPCDFIIALKGADGAGPSRDLLMANCLAQTEALLKGRTAADLASTPESLRPHREFTGNRPSNTLLLDELTPYVLGMLIALYEHKVFVQGLIWGVNSFDQWGVELGKELAKSLMPALRDKPAAAEGLLKARDSSTAGLALAYLQAKAQQ
ncbi:MAG: glucose-6-phosphate isomerase [Proteobacteria bacterium]|nr:glucose-6-phosphate isomerase [Pseudomonadota bacterium]